MTPPRTQRTQECASGQARARLNQARKFIEVAELVGDEATIPESVNVSAALAVLAGIAAADAACCAALGRRSRSPNHHEAEALLDQIADGGSTAGRRLRRIINEKDAAHYGLTHVGGQTLTTLMRQARGLIDFADEVLRR